MSSPFLCHQEHWDLAPDWLRAVFSSSPSESKVGFEISFIQEETTCLALPNPSLSCYHNPMDCVTHSSSITTIFLRRAK